MKKKFILPLIMLLCCNLGHGQVSQSENNISDKENVLTAKQKKLVYENLKNFHDQTQVSFAVIKNGAVGFYGVKRENDLLSDSPNADKVFEIGSITKVFTSTLLANFVLDGKLEADDKINDYLKIKLKDGIQISFKQLANHTSGLARMPSNFNFAAALSPDNPYKNFDEKMLEWYLTQALKLEYAQGTKSEYSNLGVGLLSYTLCKIVDTDFQSLLKSYIFSKYKMASSTTIRDEIAEKLVIGRDSIGKETSNWDLNAMAGAGAILSSVEDLSKFALAQFDIANKELALTRVKTFADPGSMDVCLGWFINKSKSGSEWYFHNGGTGGYRSAMALDINKKNGIIILSNVSSFHPNSRKIDELCFALMKTLDVK
ncbi:MAG: beta-lactamase family protein [Bacteroidetes bacterium]|nr:beta-lactamase family protein [Bacteroidota bacterium]